MGDCGGDYDIEEAGNFESHASANGMHLIKPTATMRYSSKLYICTEVQKGFQVELIVLY